MRFIIIILIMSFLCSISLATGYIGYNNYVPPTTYVEPPVRLKILLINTPVIDFDQLEFFYSVNRTEFILKQVVPPAPIQVNPGILKMRPQDAPVEAAAQPQYNTGEASFDLFKQQIKTFNDTPDLDRSIKKIFAANCLSCHKPGISKNGVVLFDKNVNLFKLADYEKERKRRQAIIDSIESGEMPKNKTPLVRSDIEKIKEWLGRQ